MPSVSIILATYNRGHLLNRSIQSVLNQTYQDYELIIVDDGSTDDTEKVVKIFKCEIIKYIQHDKNRGLAAARNTGIRVAKGDYIAFQDSDDEWMPEKLERQIRAFETASPVIGIVYTGRYRIINNKRDYVPPTKWTPKDGDLFNSLLRASFVAPVTALVRRECFERIGMFDEQFPVFEDWDLFLRMSRYYQFKFIGEPLAIIYPQSDSLTADTGTLIKGLKQMLKTHLEDIKQDKTVLGRYYFRLGNCLCSYGKLSQGRGYLVRSVKVYPLDIRVFSAFVVSLLGQNMYNMVAKSYRRIMKPF